jgi:hypothetical protein
MTNHKEAYQWDRKTLELQKDSVKAYEDERNPGKFLLPPCCTFQKPPKGKRGMKIVWSIKQSKWKHSKK